MKRFTVLLTAILSLFVHELFSTENNSDISAVYCTPPNYRTGPYTGIVNFSINSFNNPSSESDGYKDFSTMTNPAELKAGTSQNVEIDLYYDPVMLEYFQGNLNVRIWIDWNQDFDFTDAGEEALAVVKNCSASTMENPIIKLTATIQVPSDAKSGITRLRVYEDMVETDGHDIPNPCGYLNSTNGLGQHGECEDYKVNVEGVSTQQPMITSNMQSINFGKVELQKSSVVKLKLSNTGDATLIITKISFVDSFDNAFSILSTSLPVTIEAGMYKEIDIAFNPTKVSNYNSTIRIMSNASNYGVLEIPVSGIGEDLTDVSELDGNEMFSMSLSPNPAYTNTFLKVNLNDDNSGPMSLYISDMNGNIIQNIEMDKLVTGESSLVIDCSKLSAGKYFVVYGAGSKIQKSPLIIVK